MDSGDPTTMLLNKIKTLEPDYAPKIIGYLLLKEISEKDSLNLALGPESVLKSIISKVKVHLGLSSTPSPPSPLSTIPRLPINGRGNGFMDFGRNSPLSQKPNNGSKDNIADSADLLDDQQLNDYLSFLDDSSSKVEDLVDTDETHLHRRSFSADASFGLGDDGFKPCVYFSRGLCKNGESCKFVHGDSVDGNGLGMVSDSPRRLDSLVKHQEEMMRMRLAYQQERLASQILGRDSLLAYEKRMEALLRQHALRDGALPFGDERYWSSSPGRLERMELMAMHFGDQANAASRQIYLTFPADSTFRDEDVATYFGLFGTVQDVRIPYQQKRMFGFVSFVHSESVKVVLARGNPHFICDSRVLVKPYKEKGKVLDKKQQHILQQIEREIGNYSPCLSPSGIDPREQSDFLLGTKLFYERREMMRRKMEQQADLQRAIEFERRRFINLQLPEFKNNVALNHHRSFSVGSPGCFSPPNNLNPDFQSELINRLEVDEALVQHPYSVTNQRIFNNNFSNGGNGGTQENGMLEPDSGSTIELVLPSNLFPSATSLDDVSAGVSSSNGNHNELPTSASNLIQ